MAKPIQADMKSKSNTIHTASAELHSTRLEKGCLNNSKENKGAIEARF